jgi:hypothetical protein
MLQELAEGLVRFLSRQQIAAGSAVLMTSVTNMVAAGTAGYTDDLFRAIKYLKRNLGDHLVYGPLPNFFLNRSEDPITIHTCWEFADWAKFTFKYATASTSSKNSSQSGGRAGCKPLNGALCGCPPLTATTCWASLVETGTTSPTRCWAAAWTTKRRLWTLEAIVEKIQDKLAIDLDPNPIVDWWPCILNSRPGNPVIKTVLLIGSSHAGKIAAALRKAGHHTDVLYEANWRATPLTV